MSRIIIACLLSLLFVACKQQTDTSTVTGEVKKETETPSVSTPHTKKEEKKQEITAIAGKSLSVTVNTSSISGRKLGGLYSDITGVHGTVHKNHTVNYGELLSDLWHKKLDRNQVSEATIASADVPIKRYLNEPNKTTLHNFIHEANAQVALVNKHLDFEALCKKYDLSQERCEVSRALTRKVRGVDLIAYGMTELMPSAEGDLNLKILKILLENAGSNYLFTIPALHDDMLSLGFYQFTSHAVNGSSGEGASKVNIFMKEAKIPGSVIKLHNGEHHRAAYLFAIHNLAQLSKRTSAKEFEVLKMVLKKKPGNLITYIATAHHAPELAIKCAKAWLGNGAKGPINTYLIGRLKPYGKKSDKNLAALEKVIL